MEKVVADNLQALMDHHKHAGPSEAARYTRVSQQQIDRVLKGQKPRVDTVEKLARGYGIEPYQMLIPGLNPANPQILKELSPEEQRLYQALEEALAAAKKRGTQ